MGGAGQVGRAAVSEERPRRLDGLAHFVSQNKLLLLFLALILLQFLSWQATLQVAWEIDLLRSAYYRYSCGAEKDAPCRVIITNR